MYLCCCISFCCFRRDTLEAPIVDQDSFVENKIYGGGPWVEAKMYQSYEPEKPKPIKAIRLNPKSQEDIEQAFSLKPIRWAKRDITTLKAAKANNLAILQPAFVLVRLGEMFKEDKTNPAEGRFLDVILPENACFLILHGIQKELDEKENPGTFLRNSASLTRLIAAYIAKYRRLEHKDLILNFVKKIPSQILDEEEKEITAERIEAIREKTEGLLKLLSQIVEGIDSETLNLLMEIETLIEKKGEENPQYANLGRTLSFGHFILRSLNPLIACIELAGLDPKALEFPHKQRNAIYLSSILQYLSINPTKEDLEVKVFAKEEHFIIDLVLDFQERFNLIRDQAFSQ